MSRKVRCSVENCSNSISKFNTTSPRENGWISLMISQHPTRSAEIVLEHQFSVHFPSPQQFSFLIWGEKSAFYKITRQIIAFVCFQQKLSLANDASLIWFLQETYRIKRRGYHEVNGKTLRLWEGHDKQKPKAINFHTATLKKNKNTKHLQQVLKRAFW